METISDQIVLPQIDKGVDWGSPRKVLAQHGDYLLLWRPGHLYWTGVGMPQGYARSQACVWNRKDIYGHVETLWEGRFSREKLLANAEKIANALGISIESAKMIKPGQTLIVED